MNPMQSLAECSPHYELASSNPQSGGSRKGAFGMVFPIRDTRKCRQFACKASDAGEAAIRNGHKREIAALSLLKKAQHVVLLDGFESWGKWDYIVMEWMDVDLRVYRSTVSLGVFDYAFAQDVFYQILCGVDEIHTIGYFHRDLKPDNILVRRLPGDKVLIKVGDLGSCIAYDPARTYTNPVTTIWYRAPEVLLEADNYTPAIDIWSLGCIFMELIEEGPFLPGSYDLNQLILIFQSLGVPTNKQWAGVESMPLYKREYYPNYPGPKRDLFSAANESDESILHQMFRFDPAKRPAIQAILKHFDAG